MVGGLRDTSLLRGGFMAGVRGGRDCSSRRRVHACSRVDDDHVVDDDNDDVDDGYNVEEGS